MCDDKLQLFETSAYATTESEKERDAIAYSQLLMILRVRDTQMCVPTALPTTN